MAHILPAVWFQWWLASTLSVVEYREVTIAGIPELRVLSVTRTQTVHYEAELDRPAGRCSGCRKKLSRSGWQEVALTDLPRGQLPSVLRVRWQRYRCPHGCAQPSRLEGIQAGVCAPSASRQRGRAMTVRLAETVLRRYLTGQTVKSLSEWCGLKTDTLWNFLELEIQNFRRTPRETRDWQALTHISIDELFWRGRILCVIMDLNTGQLIDILPDRQPATLRRALEELNSIMQQHGQLQWSPLIVTDMWQDYRQVAFQVFGQRARVVVDRFHLQAKISEDLRMEALQVLLQPASIANTTYGQRAQLLSRLQSGYLVALRQRKVPQNLPADFSFLDRGVQAALLSLLQQAYQLLTIWHAQTREEAQQRYNDWEWQLGIQAFPGRGPYGRLRYLFRNWYSEIFNAFEPAYALGSGKRPTSARVEALNGQLRQLSRRSHAPSRNAFAGQSGRLEEQASYERFRLRCLALKGGILPVQKRQSFKATLRPAGDVPACCGKLPLPDQIQWRLIGRAWDAPLGGKPVRVSLEKGEWVCPLCKEKHSFQLPPVETTAALQQYVTGRRWQDASKVSLRRETGLSTQQLKSLLPVIPQPVRRAFPEVIGLLFWRWRRKIRCVITNPLTGKLLDILPDTSVLNLKEYLLTCGHPAMQICVESPDWVQKLPQRFHCAFDPLTTKRLVQPALLKVQRQYTATVPVPARRTAPYHRHRRLILMRASRLLPAEMPRLQPLLQGSAELRQAHHLLQEFHRIYDSNTVPDFTPWRHEVGHLRGRMKGEGRLESSLVYGFEEAARQLETYQDEILSGWVLRSQGVTLGSSRRLLGQLRHLTAASQPEFALLRHVALRELG